MYSVRVRPLRNSGLSRLVWLAALLVSATGGMAPVAQASPGARTAVSGGDPASALESYNRWAGDLATLRGGGKARLGAPGEKERGFQFSLALARPDRARLQGRFGNLTVVFDLAASDGTWTLFLPREKEFVRSADVEAAAGMLLPPSDLITVLLPAPLPVAEIAARGALREEGEGFRVVAPPAPGPGRVAHRVLLLDRRGLPRRLELRRESQFETPFLVVRYENWEASEGREYPRRVTAEVPETGEWARFEFENLKFEESLNPKRFTVLIPPGTREVSLESLSPDFLPEAEGQR